MQQRSTQRRSARRSGEPTSQQRSSQRRSARQSAEPTAAEYARFLQLRKQQGEVGYDGPAKLGLTAEMLELQRRILRVACAACPSPRPRRARRGAARGRRASAPRAPLVSREKDTAREEAPGKAGEKPTNNTADDDERSAFPMDGGAARGAGHARRAAAATARRAPRRRRRRRRRRWRPRRRARPCRACGRRRAAGARRSAHERPPDQREGARQVGDGGEARALPALPHAHRLLRRARASSTRTCASTPR